MAVTVGVARKWIATRMSEKKGRRARKGVMAQRNVTRMGEKPAAQTREESHAARP